MRLRGVAIRVAIRRRRAACSVSVPVRAAAAGAGVSVALTIVAVAPIATPRRSILATGVTRITGVATGVATIVGARVRGALVASVVTAVVATSITTISAAAATVVPAVAAATVASTRITQIAERGLVCELHQTGTYKRRNAACGKAPWACVYHLTSARSVLLLFHAASVCGVAVCWLLLSRATPAQCVFAAADLASWRPFASSLLLELIARAHVSRMHALCSTPGARDIQRVVVLAVIAELARTGVAPVEAQTDTLGGGSRGSASRGTGGRGGLLPTWRPLSLLPCFTASLAVVAHSLPCCYRRGGSRLRFLCGRR